METLRLAPTIGKRIMIITKNKSNLLYSSPILEGSKLSSFPIWKLSQKNQNISCMVDNYGRVISYLRLAVTDRCNLRCLYCMPAKGLPLVPRKELLTWEEMIYICRIFVRLGVKKIRITGGEPFIRKGLAGFLRRLNNQNPALEIGITTNGLLVDDYLEDLWETGVRQLNFSLDSLREEVLQKITGSSCLTKILAGLERAYNYGFTIKINMVVIPGINVQEILAFVEWTRDKEWTIRFIEPMPFNSYGGRYSESISGKDILTIIKSKYVIESISSGNDSVAKLYEVSGYKGKIGIINGYSRSFCRNCSRIRISSRGEMLTCLYGKPVFNLRDMLRDGTSEEDLIAAILNEVGNRKRNGFEAAEERIQYNFDSMSMIGG